MPPLTYSVFSSVLVPSNLGTLGTVYTGETYCHGLPTLGTFVVGEVTLPRATIVLTDTTFFRLNSKHEYGPFWSNVSCCCQCS